MKQQGSLIKNCAQIAKSRKPSLPKVFPLAPPFLLSKIAKQISLHKPCLTT